MIFVIAFASAFAAALDGGLADFGRSSLTLTVTPIARPNCTAVLMVTLAFDGTRQRVRTPRIGPVSCSSLRWTRSSWTFSASGAARACS